MVTCSGDSRHVEDLRPRLADICTRGDETHETHSPRSWDPTHLLDAPTLPQPRPVAHLGSAGMGWGLGLCISNHLPGEAYTTRPGDHKALMGLWENSFWVVGSQGMCDLI